MKSVLNLKFRRYFFRRRRLCYNLHLTDLQNTSTERNIKKIWEQWGEWRPSACAQTRLRCLSRYDSIHLSGFHCWSLLIQTCALLRHFLKRPIQDMCCGCKCGLFWQDLRTRGKGRGGGLYLRTCIPRFSFGIPGGEWNTEPEKGFLCWQGLCRSA